VKGAKEMRLELGKEYRARDGSGPHEIVKIVSGKATYPCVAMYDGRSNSFRQDGRYGVSQECGHDLVALWEETPEPEIKVGSKWLFVNSDGRFGNLWEVEKRYSKKHNDHPIKLISGCSAPWWVDAGYLKKNFKPEVEEEKPEINFDDLGDTQTCKDPCDGGWIYGYGPKYRCPQCKPKKPEKEKPRVSKERSIELYEKHLADVNRCHGYNLMTESDGMGSEKRSIAEDKVTLAHERIALDEQARLKPTRSELIKQTWGL